MSDKSKKGAVTGDQGTDGGLAPGREGRTTVRKGYTPVTGQVRPQAPETATGESPGPAATTQRASAED